MRQILRQLATSLIATALLAILLCCAYPLVVWGIAQGLFHFKANGSMIVMQDKIVASDLIAQNFAGMQFFHPRPSAANYNAAHSSGSNLGPTSQKLIDLAKQRAATYRQINGLSENTAIPADAISASGSGLDPHISIQNALLQIPRVAKQRGLSEDYVRAKVQKHIESRQWGLFGEPRVNVLTLNLALEEGKE